MATIQNGIHTSNQLCHSHSPALRTNLSSHATPNLSQEFHLMSIRSCTIFGGFLNAAHMGIRSPEHESDLVGVLQLAADHPEVMFLHWVTMIMQDGLEVISMPFSKMTVL